MSNPVTFEIGITMAGAISAGAYAGGFFDFLCEALEEWEKARIAAPHAVPNHRVCIKAISGASAGSITAALALVSLAKANPPPAGVPYTLSGLYRGWVTGIDIARAGGADDLLDLSDLEMAGGGEKDRKEAIIRSLLSTNCIDKVAQAIVDAPPAPTGRLYAWLASPLPCYFTITNMRGIPYMVRFDKDRGHGMVSHADRAHFSLKGLGGCEADNVWCKNDAPVDISLNDMRSGNAAMQPFLDAALASGAFPVGLSSRKVTLALDGYDKRQWPRLDGIGTRIAPDWPGNFRLDRKGVPFMAIDGGLIDNEPFGLVHRALLPAGSDHNPPNADEVVRAVIMIDPFPEIPTFEVKMNKPATKH